MKVDWKIGDRCWYFDSYNRVVSSAIIKNIGYNVLNAIDERTGMPIGFDEHTLPFPTREALCEHYRRIFESNSMEDLTDREILHKMLDKILDTNGAENYAIWTQFLPGFIGEREKQVTYRLRIDAEKTVTCTDL